MKEIQDGKVIRKTVVITLLDDEMNEVASWQLEKCWSTKYTAPRFQRHQQRDGHREPGAGDRGHQTDQVSGEEI